MNSCKIELQKLTDENNGIYNTMQEKLKQKDTEIKAREDEKIELDTMFKEATAESLDLQKKLISCEQMLKANEDANEKAAEYEQMVDGIQKEKMKLEKNIRDLGDELGKLAKKASELEQKNHEYEMEIQVKEQEIESLSSELMSFKQKRPEYLPVKGDFTDTKLAEHLNRSPELQGVALMFTRESEGVYRFGTKRVFVKVEKDKIMVRVGGGFLVLDEFIELYAPLEIEKINNKKCHVEMSGEIIS